MQNDRKRKKANYYKASAKKSKFTDELKTGVKGFLITCGNDERRTTLEAYQILNEYADQLYGPEVNKQNKEGEEVREEEAKEQEDDIEDILKQQISDIKELTKSTNRRFQRLHTKAKNVIFIKTTIENPNELVLNIFDDIVKTQIKKTKKILRFLPVLTTCSATVDHIVKAVQPIVNEYFQEGKQSFTYCIMWKSRCNDKLKRDNVLPSIVDYIVSKNVTCKTDYSNPDFVLNLDIIGNICCIGFIKDFHGYHKYNMDNLVKLDPKNEEKKNETNVSGSDHENQHVEGVDISTSINCGDTKEDETKEVEMQERKEEKEEKKQKEDEEKNIRLQETLSVVDEVV